MLPIAYHNPKVAQRLTWTLLLMAAVLIAGCAVVIALLLWNAGRGTLPPMAAQPGYIVIQALLCAAMAVGLVSWTAAAIRNIRQDGPSIFVDGKKLVVFNPFRQAAALDEIGDIVVKRRLSIYGRVEEISVFGHDRKKQLILINPVYHSINAADIVAKIRDLAASPQQGPWL